ncbi:hypothetical protein BH10ACT8_BH10ACT8_28920 [soil metagenome]
MHPLVHLIDETWIDRPVDDVAAAVAQPSNWAEWWPTLTLTVTRDRGLKGIQWSATGSMRGSVELWLEPVSSGVLLHHFLRLDPPAAERWSARRVRRETRRLAWHAKRVFWQLKDNLEAGDG